MATTEERVSYLEGRMESLATKEDLAELKGELLTGMAELKGEIMAHVARAEARTTRWTVGVMIAAVGVISAVAIAL